VNILDLLTATLFQPLFDKFDTDEKVSALKEEELTEILESKAGAFEQAIKDVLGKSEESKVLRVFDSKDPLNKLMDAFGAGVHRVLVKQGGESGVVYTYISQTDVVRSLKQVAVKSGTPLGGSLVQTLAELKLSSKEAKIVSVSSSARAITGFRSMISQTKQRSAVPVIDASKGCLVDTLSASDFRGVRHDSTRLLLLPVPEFLKLSRAKPRQAISSHKNLVCSEDEALSVVIERIITSGVHRLWVIGPDESIVGVISLTDIIRQFAPSTSS